jgi:hypothetical protein
MHELWIGSKPAGITVEPDTQWPHMWRIRTPDGRVSDMVNLTRAKDAALAWAQRHEFINVRRDARWNTIKTASGASLAQEKSESELG